MSCLIPVDASACSPRSERVGSAEFDLVDRPRHDEPEEPDDHADQDEVVDADPGGARDAPAGKAFDRRPHRGREDEGEEEERDEQPQLPERKREHDDPADHERGERGPLGGLGHSARVFPALGSG